MNKETIKKVTLDDLVAKAAQKERDRKKTKDIKTKINDEEMVLTFVKPHQSVVINAIEEVGDGENITNIIEAFTHLIYECCPMLQDSDLQKSLEVKDPYDTVNKLFEIGEIMTIGNQLSDLIGLRNITDTVKN